MNLHGNVVKQSSNNQVIGRGFSKKTNIKRPKSSIIANINRLNVRRTSGIREIKRQKREAFRNRQTSHVKHQSSNISRQTSNVKP
jgi:hypothetical protein